MEIVISFFAAIGALCLLREALLFFIYRRQTGGVWLKVDLKKYGEASFLRLLHTVCDVRASRQGRALIKGLELCGRGFDPDAARSLAERLGVPVRVRRRARIRRSCQAPSAPPGA